jgi:hypothetical protein
MDIKALSEKEAELQAQGGFLLCLQHLQERCVERNIGKGQRKKLRRALLSARNFLAGRWSVSIFDQQNPTAPRPSVTGEGYIVTTVKSDGMHEGKQNDTVLRVVF